MLIQPMPFDFVLRLARRRGRPAGAVDRHLCRRGRLEVTEARDDELRRTVRTATFAVEGDDDPVPPLHDVVLLGMRGSLMSLAGYEEVPDGPLEDLRRYQQTWLLSPASERDLDRAIEQVSRLVGRLRELGIPVQMLPGGDMLIPGERRWQDTV